MVIMGMGEPLANFDHLLKALRLLNAGWGRRMARKITVSTSGLAPRRGGGRLEQFSLAVSLHGARTRFATGSCRSIASSR